MFLYGDEVDSDSDRDSVNEDSDDDNVLDLGVRNLKDSDSSGDEEEEKDKIPPRAPISRNNTVLLKDAGARLVDEHHNVT